MKPSGKTTEKGQVVVILAIVLVSLLGFAALAVDVGAIFSDRRYDQNAADAAALAGAVAAAQVMEDRHVSYEAFTCSGSNADLQAAIANAVTAAKQRASDNDFTIEDNLDNQHGVAVECGNVDNGSYFTQYLDIKVMITSEVKTAFAHLFYPGPFRNTVQAVSRVRPRISPGLGYAIVTLSTTCTANEDNLIFSGSSTVTINNSGVFSNSCMKANGHVVVNADDGIKYIEESVLAGGVTVSPPPDKVSIPLPSIPFSPPDCSGLEDRGSWSGSGTISPGRYTQIRLNNGDLTMQSGLYCLSGDFTVTGGTLDGQQGVTIYMTGGDFSSAGSATLKLSAPTTNNPPALRGMLIFLAQGNTGNVTLAGTVDSFFTGTIYVPSGSIDLGGNNSMVNEYETQVIGNTVNVHGDVNMVINYDNAVHFEVPTSLDLYQ
ncbi:MAG: hypothetical protein GYA59_08950 [Chloroflexi bacterium]|nr:hypothetical protein [Chloroflexota bacterium]